MSFVLRMILIRQFGPMEFGKVGFATSGAGTRRRAAGDRARLLDLAGGAHVLPEKPGPDSLRRHDGEVRNQAPVPVSRLRGGPWNAAFRATCFWEAKGTARAASRPGDSDGRLGRLVV